MIDNFELIRPHFYFNEANNMFFLCQIVQRAKDHPGCKVKEGAIATYIIRSKTHLDSLKDEIVTLCEHYGARAYINIAGKDFFKVNRALLLKLASCLDNCNENVNPERLLKRALGETISRNPKWIIDIDNIEDKVPVYHWLQSLGWEDYQIIEIPTVQCCHFITSKFNLEEFKQIFPHIDVHKNSMGTLLYYPQNLTKNEE